MRRIDEVIREIKTTDVHAEIDSNIWVPARPMPFQYGLITTGYWRDKWQKFKDAWKVFTGYAEDIDWGQGKRH